MLSRSGIAPVLPFRTLLALLWLCWASAAAAHEVPLRDRFEVVSPPIAVQSLDTQDNWTWLELRDAPSLRAMPADWLLLIDQVRFRTIRVVAETADGETQDIALGADRLDGHWAAGGLLKFTIAAPGREIRHLWIGFERIDDVSLMRKVTAATPERAATLEARWLLLIGTFAGLLVSAFTYNLFVHAGRRSTFQRWYLGWVSVSLAYGLLWSNVAAYAYPTLAGPLAVRIDNVLVGLSVALASLFLLSVLERDTVSARLARATRATAAACALAGLAAADERLVPASTGDLVLNLALVACVLASLAVIVVAARRGSEVVWLYLIGWTPVIAVFALRAARNFGLVEQSDLVDMATFAAIGFESLVFSVAVASRFTTLRRERDAAQASALGLEVERETLERAAHSDFLTGLGNRAAFHGRLRELFERKAGFALLLIDVDYLKELNDRQGHDAGDALLQHIGDRLADIVDAHVSCSRIGGDEFAILCEGDSSAVVDKLDGLQGTLWGRGAWSGILSLSVGTADSSGASSPADMFQQADLALYEAKRLGRGRRHAFDSQLRDRIQARLDLVREAHWGLRRSEFLLHFQPIVDVRTGRHVGVEALLRWDHPARGMLTPEAFGCVLADREIGAAVQRHAISLAIEELRRNPAFPGTLAVNFTALDLYGADSARRILKQLAAAGVPPAFLCVEVTEGIILGKGGNEPAAALHVLHEAGARIALDDFGTGYASLVHLKEIPVDILKIDRSFIAGLLRPGDQSEEIVRAVLALGHGLNKTVVAEGVETLEQLARLRELGCDFAQGYLFGRPAPAYDLSATFQAAA
jgi:diguanylate cyclase (GGDEF)-like protein